MIQMGMGDQDMIDPNLFFQRQDRCHRTGIEQGCCVNQESRKAATGELRTMAAQYPDFHYFFTLCPEA